MQRGLIADIIKRFEQKGYKLVAIKARHALTCTCELCPFPGGHHSTSAAHLPSACMQQVLFSGARLSLCAGSMRRCEGPNAAQVMVPSEELAGKHYQEHAQRPFYPGLVKFLSSGPVVAMVWEGKDVIKCGLFIFRRLPLLKQHTCAVKYQLHNGVCSQTANTPAQRP